MTAAEMNLPNFTQLRIYPSFTEIRQEYNAPKVSSICSNELIIKITFYFIDI